MQQHSPNSKTETENLNQEGVTTQKLLLTNVSSRGLINSLPCRSDGDFDENMQINYRRTNAEKRPATSLRLRERRTIDRRAMKTLTKRETLRRDTNACRIQSPQCADRRNVNQTLIDNRSLNIGERHQSSIFKLHSRSRKILPSSQQQGDSETFMNGLPTRDSGVLFVIFKNNVNQPQVCSPQLNNLKSLRKDTYSSNDVVLSKLLTLKSEVFHERPSNRSSLIKNLLLLDTSICSIERRNQWKSWSPLVTLRRFLKFWKISTISAAAIDNRAPLVPNNVQKGTGCGWERINTIIPKEEMVKWILKKVLQEQQTASKRSSCKKPNGADKNRNCIKTKLRTTKKRAMGALGLDRVVIRGDPKRFIQNRRRPTDFIVNQPQPRATMMTNSRECPEIDVVVIIICTVAGGGCQQQKQYQRSRHKKYRAKTTTSEFTISSSSSSSLLLSSLLSAGICLQPRTCWRGLLQRKGTLKHVKSTNSCVYVQLTHPWRPQRFGFYHLVQPQAVFIKPLLKLSQTLLLLLILLILLILLSSPLLVPLPLAATASLRDKVLTLKFKIKNDYPCKRKRRCIMFNSRIGDGGSGKGCASDSESGGDICCSCESRNFFVVVKTPKIMKKEAARLSGENMPRQFGPLVYNVIICPCICRIVLVQRSDLKKNYKNDIDNYNYNYNYYTNDTECYHYFISGTGCEIPDRRAILTKGPNTTLKIKSNSTLVKHGTEKKEQKFVNNNNHNNNNTQYKNKRNTCHSLGNRNTILNNTTACFLAPFARCNIMCSGLLLRDDRPAKNRRQKNDSFSYAKNDSLFSGRCDSSFKSKPPFTHPNEQLPPKSSVRLTHTRGCRTLTGRKNHRASGQNDWTSIFIILRIGGLRIRFKYKKAIIAYTNKTTTTTTTTTTTNHSIHDKNETNKNTENVYCCYRSPSVLLLFFFFFLRKKKKAKEVEVDDDGKLYGPVPFVINSQKDKVRLLEGYRRSNSGPGLAVGQRKKRKKTVTTVLALSDENLSCNGSDVHVRIRTNSVVDAIYNYCYYYYNSYYFDEIRKPVFRDKIRYLNLLRAADRKLEERGERVGCVVFASNDGWIQQRKDVSILTVRKAVTGAALKEEEEDDEKGEFNFGKTSRPWLTSIANRSVTSRELREKKGIANKHEEKKEMKRCSSSYNCIRGRAGACAVKGGEGRMKERSNSIGGGRGEEKGNSLRRRRISRSRKGGSRVGGVRLAPLFLAVPGSSDYYEATVDARHGSFEHAGNLFTATATSSERTRRLLARTMDTTSPGIPTTATRSQQKHRLVFDRIRHCDSYKPTAMNPINNKHTVSHNPTTSDTNNNNNNNTATNIKTKNKITHTNKKSLAISNDDFKLNQSFNTTKSTPIRFGEHAYYNNTYNNSNTNININNGLIVSETRHSRKGVPSEPRGQTHEEGLSSAYSTPSPSASLASQPSSSSCSYVGRSGRHHNPGSWPLPTATSPQHPHHRQQQQQQQQQHRHNHNHNPLQKQPQQKHGLSQNNSNNNNKNITNNNINNTNNSNKNKNNNNSNNNNGNKMSVSSFCYDFCDSIKDFGPRFSGLKTLVSRFLPNWGKTFLSLLLVFHVVGTSLLAGAVPLPRRKNTNEVKGLDYLMNFGYVSGPSQEAENLMSEDVKVESIKRFQTFANLPVTGIFDHRTMEMMEKPRCGNKDRPALDMHSGRTKRYILSESRWGRTNLTFRFLNYTPDINFPKIRKAIYDAFLVWSRVTHLTFTEIMFDSNNGKDADIRIQFAQRYHHDGYPFDGEGIILAHAFFPGEDRGGDTHFDDDEHWTFDSGEGVNLFMVAAHEFGHALGLSHSKTQGSLMYPWYQDQQSKGYKLPQDDVDGIQKLYGVKNGNETIDILVKEFDDNNPPDTDSDTPGVDEVPHGNCTHTFDAITKIRGDVYIFKGKYFWRWTSGALKDSKPIPISHFWYQFPESSIDAVFERKRDSKIMFFKGDKYWLYDANHMERGWPLEGRPLVELGLPGDLKKIDAAFTWSFNKRTYLVSNDMYWKFNEMESYMVYDYPRAMTIWQGVPTPLDAAFQFTDSKTYFIKGKHYWEYEDQKMRVKSREPTGNIAERWMQCPSAQKRVPYNNKKQMIYPTNGSSRMVEASGLLMWGLSYITRRLIV